MLHQRLIVLVDGTWNRADPPPGVERGNAARIAQSLLAADPFGTRQTVAYIEGVGTGGPIDVHCKAYTGHGIVKKIREAYLFLAHNWKASDQIWLFGASRGAFVVRALGQWIAERGLLHPSELSLLRESWAAYRDRREEGPRGRSAAIRMIGAFDMVDALGIPIRGLREISRPRVGKRKPDLPPNVEAAYHALAFDEHRAAFRPTLWNVSPGDPRPVEQLWFAGSHGDVCGGFGKRGLSDIPLDWMIERARERGLAFDDDRLRDELRPNLALAPSTQRTGLHLLLKRVNRRPLETSPHTEALHESLVRKARDPADPYGRGRIAQFLDHQQEPRQEPRQGALSE